MKNEFYEKPLVDDEVKTEPITERHPEEKEEKVPATVYGIVANAPNVNLRKTPKMDPDNVIGILQEGTKVQILPGANQLFKKVKATIGANERTGFIHVDYIKEV